VGDRHTRLPTETEIAEINAKHLISTPIKPADLLFMFGTREDVERRVDEAVRLWRDGLFRWSSERRCDAGLNAFRMRDHQNCHGCARHSG
jgi:hypothetical protein